MKKLILAIAVAFIGFSIGKAQFMESLQIGVKGGYNYSSLSFSDNSDRFKTDGLHGFHLGLFVEIPIMDKLSVQPEIVYSTQGDASNFKEKIISTLVEAENNIKLNYLNVPIMVKYYVIDGLSIDLGPQIGFLTDFESKYKTTISDAVLGNHTTEGELKKDNIKSIDFGLGLGATYKIGVIDGLAISARYNLGLTDISKDVVKNSISSGTGLDIEEVTSIASSKNRVIQVGLSYQF